MPSRPTSRPWGSATRPPLCSGLPLGVGDGCQEELHVVAIQPWGRVVKVDWGAPKQRRGYPEQACLTAGQDAEAELVHLGDVDLPPAGIFTGPNPRLAGACESSAAGADQ